MAFTIVKGSSGRSYASMPFLSGSHETSRRITRRTAINYRLVLRPPGRLPPGSSRKSHGAAVCPSTIAMGSSAFYSRQEQSSFEAVLN